jgi:hypothetical protein
LFAVYFPLRVSDQSTQKSLCFKFIRFVRWPSMEILFGPLEFILRNSLIMYPFGTMAVYNDIIKVVEVAELAMDHF